MLCSSVNGVYYLLNSCNRAACVLIDNVLGTTGTAKVNDLLTPTAPEAVKMYEDNSGVLTRNTEFGYDLLIHREDLYQSRQTRFHANTPTPTEIFSEVVHFRYIKLCGALRLFHRITFHLIYHI